MSLTGYNIQLNRTVYRSQCDTTHRSHVRQISSFAANLLSLDVVGCEQGVLERVVLLRLAQEVVMHFASGGKDALGGKG